MITLRFLKRFPSSFVSLRTFNTSRANTRAIKNWERPSIDEMMVPKDPWQRVFDKNQKRYNAHLLAGLAVFSGTALVLSANVFFNTTPDFLKSVKYSTKTPGKDEDQSGDEAVPVNDDEAVEENLEPIEAVEEIAEPLTEADKDTLNPIQPGMAFSYQN